MTPDPDHDPTTGPTCRVAADIVVFTIREGRFQVLLVERGQDTDAFRGWDALPGGLMRSDESAEEAARRELREETGVETAGMHLEQLATYSDPDRDPRNRVVSVAFLAVLPDVGPVHGGTDAADAFWVSVTELEDDIAEQPASLRRLAFDHDQIFGDAVTRARAKFEYTTVATRFCPPEFTMNDLRHVYAAVWNAELDDLDAANFRRKVERIEGFVHKLDRTTREPSQPWSEPDARESWSLQLLENRRLSSPMLLDVATGGPTLAAASTTADTGTRRGRPPTLYRRANDEDTTFYPPFKKPDAQGD